MVPAKSSKISSIHSLERMSREWIEEILEDFAGTMLFVSHDRYFIDRFATRILSLEEDGCTDYPDTYENFLRFKKTQTTTPAQKEKNQSKNPETDKKPNTYLQQKEQKRREQQLRELEKKIEEQEAALAALDEEIQKEATNPEVLLTLVEKREKEVTAIDKLYDECEELLAEA